MRGTDITLLGVGREAVDGVAAIGGPAGFTKPKKLEYRFEGAGSGVPPTVISPPASMEIEYSFNAEGKDLRVVLEAEGYSWGLPLYEQGVISHYAIPVLYPGNFNITLTGKSDNNSIKIHSIEFKERWFGLFSLYDGSTARIYRTPFVAWRSGDPDGSSAYEIDVPESFSVPSDFYPVISAVLIRGKDAAFDAGKLHLDLSPALKR